MTGPAWASSLFLGQSATDRGRGQEAYLYVPGTAPKNRDHNEPERHTNRCQ